MGKQTQNKNKQSTGFGAKHRKAKVGKRAIKPANITDTSFKTASLHIQKQAIESTTTADSKEKLLSFLSQTTHHAPAARCAAVKGIRNIIGADGADGADGKMKMLVLVPQYLNMILPCLSRNLVDEDVDVRDVVIPTLNELLQFCVGNDIPIKPFLPLHIAYITSGLNSLDSYVRRDGVRAVEIVAKHFPLLLKHYVSTLLPAYARVLADCRGRSRSRSNVNVNVKKKKGKKDGSPSSVSSNPERCFALRSLVALLQTANPSNSFEFESREKEYTSHNSIIVYRSFTAHSIELDESTNNPLPIRTILQLLLNLRDSWVELTQGTIPLSHLEEVSLLLSSFQLLHHQYSLPLYLHYKTHSPEKNEEKQLSQFNSLLEKLPLLDSFPLVPDTDKAVPLQYHSANSLFCLFLSDLGSSPIPTQNDWSIKLLEYLLPRYQSSSRMSFVQQQPIIKCDLQVMAKLLLKSNDTYILKDDDRLKLFETFINYFICLDHKSKPKNFFQVVMITTNVIPLLSKIIHEIGNTEKNFIINLLQKDTELGKLIHKTLLQLPNLFQIMGVDYPKELNIFLDILLFVVRQWNGVYGDDSLSEFMRSLYDSMIELFVDSSDDEEDLGFLIENQPWNVPVFHVGDDAKRKIIGILALLKSCS